MHPGPKALVVGSLICLVGFFGGMLLLARGLPPVDSSPASLLVAFYTGFLVVMITCMTGLAYLILSAPKVVDWMSGAAWSRRFGAVFFFLSGVILFALLGWVFMQARIDSSHAESIYLVGGLVTASLSCFGYARRLSRRQTSSGSTRRLKPTDSRRPGPDT